MKITDRMLHQIRRKIPAFLCAVFVVVLVGLYYLGVYDLSFIERPAGWEGNIDRLYKAFGIGQVVDAGEQPEPAPDTEPQTPEDTRRPNNHGSGGTPGTRPNKPAKLEISTVSELREQGYVMTDAVFGAGFRFAKLETSYSMPWEFSYTEKIYDKEELTYFEEGEEPVRNVVRATAVRPALELYMGYILYDDRGALYLLGPDGTPLCRYDDTRYIPAYTRDKKGRPLFYTTYNYTVAYPTSLGEPDEDGNREWLQTASLTLEGKKYYYLAENGQTFVESDYDDVTDNRGLYFDYPAYYGLGDGDLNRYYKRYTRVQTDLDGKTTAKEGADWLYGKTAPDYNYEPETEEDPPAPEFPYTMAYPYNGGYAAVLRDVEWDYYADAKEDGQVVNKKFDVVSNEMRVIDANGKEMFASRKNYLSSDNWYANERFVEPLSRGIDALGSYYFDHGLMRLHIQAYDRFHFTEYDLIRIVSEEDVLVRPDGTRFSIPNGYRLVSYSDGILLLERDGLYGYMTSTGVWILQPEATDAKPFLEGVAVVQRNGKYGVINTDGDLVLPSEFDYISNVSSGNIVAYSAEKGWSIYQKMMPQ